MSMVMGIAEFGIPMAVMGISYTFGAMALIIVVTYIMKRIFKVKAAPAPAPKAEKKS